MVMSFTMVASGSTKRDRIKSLESFRFIEINCALRRRSPVPGSIIAVGVLHVLLSELLHFSPLFLCDASRNGPRLWCIVTFGELLNRIDGTAMENKVWESCHVRGILVTNPVSTTISGPIRPVPYCCIQSHWFRREGPTHCLSFLDLSNRNIVHIKAASKFWKSNKTNRNGSMHFRNTDTNRTHNESVLHI